jgi:hypothetical protein
MQELVEGKGEELALSAFFGAAFCMLAACAATCGAGTQFTCFAGTKVQLLLPRRCFLHAGGVCGHLWGRFCSALVPLIL